MKKVFQSPRFVFGLVWVLTAALFIWGWSGPFSAVRQRVQTLTERKQVAGPVVTPVSATKLFAKVREPGARVSVVNIWATWCEPCRREIPAFVRLHGTEGVRVLLVSGDDPAEELAVKKFLREQSVSFETFRIAGSIPLFMKELMPSWSGALPATFLFNSEGRLHSFFLGELSEEKLRQKVEGALETP